MVRIFLLLSRKRRTFANKQQLISIFLGMKRLQLLLLALLPLCAMADDISTQQAEQIALSFDHSRRAAARTADGSEVSSAVRLVESRTQNGAPLYHLFNRKGGGFVLVAGSDAVRSVLAYSDTDTISAMADLPPAMQEMIEAYGTYVQESRHRAGDNFGDDLPEPTTAVSPLIKTTWNQTPPFNSMCPIYNSSRCITGCVATAMAQIMKYHSYPATGTGSHSYQWNNQTLSTDLSAHTYKWNKMLTSYSSASYTNENVQSVAQLMFDCGVVCEANYGANLTYASIYRQFVDYFGYDSGSAWMYKNQTSNAQWERIINDELLAARPVYYCAQDKNYSGHLFIVDGCDNNNYFHINWGWGGNQDGYFTLTLPDKRGDYWDRPSCIIGLKPGTETSEPDFTVALPYNLESPIIAMTGHTSYGLFRGNFTNHSTQDLKVERGTRFTSVTTGETYYYGDGYVETWKAKEETENYYFNLQELPVAEDSYIVEPVYRINGEGDWQSFRPLRNDIAPVKLQVVNNIEPSNQRIYIVGNLTLTSSRTALRNDPDNWIEAYGNVVVDGSYTGDYIFGLMLKDIRSSATQFIPAGSRTLRPGGERYVYVGIPASCVSYDGTFNIELAYREAAYGSEWKAIKQANGLASQVKNLLVKGGEGSVPQLIISDFGIETNTVENVLQVTVKTKIKAVNDIKATLITYWTLGSQDEDIDLKAGESQEFIYTNTYPNASADIQYYAYTFYEINKEYYYPSVNYLYYTLLPPTTDIQQPATQQADDDDMVSVYLTSGVCIRQGLTQREALRNLQHGTYILRTTDGRTRKITR